MAKDSGLVAKGLLGHDDLGTTQDFYIKPVTAETHKAMQLVQQQTLALMEKRKNQAVV